MRTPWPAAVGGVAVALVGAAGLVRGAVPPAPPAATPQAPIVVSGAYVRLAADSGTVQLTARNATDRADTLQSVVSGAGRAVLRGTLTVPAQGRLVLSTRRSGLIIDSVGTLRPGQTVNLALQFARAGEVPVTAKVVAHDAPAPTGGS